MNGLLVLNKPLGVTSRTVVDRVEEWFAGARVGHAGTLDPLAIGVLVLCLGSATRLIEYVQQMAKTYRVIIRLGAWSETDDAEGPIYALTETTPPAMDEVKTCLAEFVGVIEQTPPAYSAAHVEGRRAYRLARKGKAVPLAPRRVEIHRIDLVHYDFPYLELIVSCGKGTYIRSLARDLGKKLGSGGYVEALQRTRIGPFRQEDAIALEAGPDEARRRILPLAAAVADLPSLVLSDSELARLRQGQRVRPDAPPALRQGDEAAVFTTGGELAGILVWNEALFRPRKML